MRIRVIIAFIFLGLILAASGRMLTADERPTIFIKDLVAGKGVPASEAARISNIFSNAITRTNKYEVMSHAVVEQLMASQNMKESLECNNEACMKEIMRVTQTEYLAFGEIIRQGREYEISIKLLHRKKQDGISVIAGDSYQPLSDLKLNTIRQWGSLAMRDLHGSKVQVAEPGTPAQPDQAGQTFVPQSTGHDTKDSAIAVRSLPLRGSFASPTRTTMWYKLPKNRVENRSIVMRHEPGRDFDFKLYDDSRQIGHAGGTGNEESISCGAIQGNCYLQIWNYQGSGDFTIEAKSIKSFADDKEPNNDKSQATLIRRSMSIRGAIANQGDVDWYRLGGQEGTNPTITLRHSEGKDFDMEVYSGDQQVGSALGTQSTDSINCNIPSTGYLKIYSHRGEGEYTIDIAKGSRMQVSTSAASSGHDIEPNDSKEQASRTSSMEIAGVLSSAGDVDWYLLTGQEGVNPTFSLTHEPGRDFDLQVYSGDNQVGIALGVSSPDVVSCRVPGTGYLRVYSSTGYGPYRIVISRQGATPVVSYTGTGGTGEREPNDNKYQATRTNARSFSGRISHQGDVDWYVLDGQEGVRPTFVINHDPGTDIDFEVFSGDNQVGSALGTGSPDRVSCHVPGTCYIRVYSYSGTGNYTISIE